jgi:predicted metalloprotease with PDZ domain
MAATALDKAPHYRIRPADLHAHRFEVECVVAAPAPGGQIFRLPAWIRGSYLIRDFSKHVMDLRAEANGEVVAVTRLDKRSLQCAPCSGPLLLRYSVHAFDPSVRKAWLDQNRGFFNASSLCFRVEDHEGSVDLTLEAPPQAPHWRASSAMPALDVDSRGFGRYRCADYEELIDHPFELGEFREVCFDVDGVPHALVLTKPSPADDARLAEDLKRICAVQREMFGGEPALDRYLFLTNVTASSYGGLEHRASSALVCAQDDLPRVGEAMTRRYRQFLGLCSHEYFHLWNVKRITPAGFAASDLGAEAYTRDLWHYEGVTSYYDDLFLRRAECIKAEEYLELVAETATRVERTPGRFRHSLADASFEAWTKFYQPDEYTPNATVSYYAKGALAALCLDLTLRLESSITLDDVMRTLWARYGRGGTPVPDGGLEAIACECSGLDLSQRFDAWLRGTDDLPVATLLAAFGVNAERVVDANTPERHARLGLRLRPGETIIATVLSDSPAERAGLAGGDELVAIDDVRVTATNLERVYHRLHAGQSVRVLAFRDGGLLDLQLTPEAPLADRWRFELAKDIDDSVQQRRTAWLGA